MPYSSEKQRRFMYAAHPAIAKKWAAEGNNFIKSPSNFKKAITEAKKQHG